MNTVKKCSKCCLLKTLDEFYVNRQAKDGLDHRCKSCGRAYTTARYRRKAQPRKRNPPGQFKHGAHGYKVKGCRCSVCNEARRVYDQKWRLNNPDKIKARRQRFEETHRTHRASYTRNYRARKTKAAGTATPQQVKDRIAFYGERCYLCRQPYQDIDHVIPLSRGGSNWPANLRPICKKCNGTKWAFPLKQVAPLLSSYSFVLV